MDSETKRAWRRLTRELGERSHPSAQMGLPVFARNLQIQKLL